jgi:hypothetical protein
MDLYVALAAGVILDEKEIIIKMYPSEIRASYTTKEYPEGRKNAIRREQYKGRQRLFHRTKEFYATLRRFPRDFLARLQTPSCWSRMTKKEQLIYIRYRYAQKRWQWYMRTDEGHKPNRNAAKPWGIIRDDAYDYLKSNPLIREVL